MNPTQDGVRIVIDLKKDGLPNKILNQLFKYSSLQETFHVNMLALVDGIEPQVLNLKNILGVLHQASLRSYHATHAV
jgi:DNA gyrase subunit A